MLNLYWFFAAAAGAGLAAQAGVNTQRRTATGSAIRTSRAAYVLAAVTLARPLGVATLFAAIIVGQLTAGLVIDHFGWFNVPVHRLSAERLLGTAPLVAGMARIRWR